MRATSIAICSLTAAAILSAIGCHSKSIDPADFRYALDDYYRLQPHCLWPGPVNIPAEADNKNKEQTQQYNALTHAGVLEHLPVAKGQSPAGLVQVDQYVLSALGRTYWTADPKEPGWGNFCFAHPQVTSIDSFSPPGASVAYTVKYHYSIDLPGWANTSAVKSAFPQIAAEGSGAATATLVRQGTLWQVQNVKN